ncbi:KATNB1-like protein 1 [Gouania willdenowi]|uniref:KATNB1-like protein 1 n=1 Tax=Gouania willdenowi TaxID=441366 RepID=A0A8C5HFR3_GOUWI|nr:KATNB1-like protein 1 [Gouania willdenowi]XP_028294070.1 KATNB1-like protein 1 [Gouania willdenowi]XP_028294071.1 KATNB1-like protein 1 [Gouania willdenowi]
MASNYDDRDDQNIDNDFHNEAAQYTVSYAQKNSQEVTHHTNEELHKNRFPVGRTGNHPGRAKRVVSCKRKTHRLLVPRKKQLGFGRTCVSTNKENDLKCLQNTLQFDMDTMDLPLNADNNKNSCRSESEQNDYRMLTELSKDHSIMTDVLFGRNLRLKVASTLWQRNVGELLTYFMRIQDTAVFVDFLPLITKRIDERSSSMTIGCCVDLLPLVMKVLKKPYEEYLIVGLKWITSVLNHWSRELKASGYNRAAKLQLDENYQNFNQHLSEFWHKDPLYKYLSGVAGDLAKVVDSFLAQLSRQP